MLIWDDDSQPDSQPQPDRFIVLLRVLAVLLACAVVGPLLAPNYANEMRALCWFMAAAVCGAGAVWGEDVP